MCRRKEYILVWESSDTVCAPGGLPHSSMLDVWLPAREREKEREREGSFEIAVRARCRALLTALSVTWWS